MDHLRAYRLLVLLIGGTMLGGFAACNSSPQSSTGRDADSVDERIAAERDAEILSFLVRQRARWQSAAITHYRFTLEDRTSNHPNAPRPIIITVRNGALVSATYESAPSIVKVGPQEREQLPTMDSLFALIEAAARGHVDSLHARYDAGAGFPYTIFIDRNVEKTTDDLHLEVRDFVSIGV